MSPSKRQAVAVVREAVAHPALEQDDGRGAPSRGLTAPVLLPPVGPVTVQIDLADALMCGLSMQTLARTGYIRDANTAAVYERVAKVLVDAARSAAKNIGGAR